VAWNEKMEMMLNVFGGKVQMCGKFTSLKQREAEKQKRKLKLYRVSFCPICFLLFSSSGRNALTGESVDKTQSIISTKHHLRCFA
jgi:hypothetical protein